MRIDHKNLPTYLRRLEEELYFQMGNKEPYCSEAWYWKPCIMVLALGEVCEDGLKTMALCGREKPTIIPIQKNTRLIAQGLEGACEVRKPLFNALMNLRDLIPKYRGYILCEDPDKREVGANSYQSISKVAIMEGTPLAAKRLEDM